MHTLMEIEFTTFKVGVTGNMTEIQSTGEEQGFQSTIALYLGGSQVSSHPSFLHKGSWGPERLSNRLPQVMKLIRSIGKALRG